MTLTPSQRESLDCHPFSQSELADAPLLENTSPEEATRIQEALDRSQQFDRHVADTMTSCQPPADFADRMLANLLIDESPVSDVEDAIESSAEISRPVRSSRRRWIQAAVALVSVSAAAAALLMFFQTTPANETEILEMASGKGGWVHDVYQTDAWQTNLAAAIESRPFHRRDFQRTPIGWRQYAVAWDEAAIAYDLRRNPFDTPAVLFAIKPAGKASVEPTSPPSRPQNHTGAWSVAMWQQNDMLFVLAGKGDVSAYRQLIRRPEFTQLYQEMGNEGAVATATLPARSTRFN